MGLDVAQALGLMLRTLLGLKGRYLEGGGSTTTTFNRQLERGSVKAAALTMLRVQIDAFQPPLVLNHCVAHHESGAAAEIYSQSFIAQHPPLTNPL